MTIKFAVFNRHRGLNQTSGNFLKLHQSPILIAVDFVQKSIVSIINFGGNHPVAGDQFIGVGKGF